MYKEERTTTSNTMKGEYIEAKTETTPSSMFSKLHHQHQYPHPQQQQQQQQHNFPFSLPFHHVSAATPRECPQQTSEDDDSRSSGGPITATPQDQAQAQKSQTSSKPNTGDGATIEVVRRPRGRPPGSKNKPKPPVFITREPEPVMTPYILEVPGGSDVVEAISRFCRRKNMGLCVLTGSGTVANVTLRQPSTTPGATVTFHGRFDILSISATFLPCMTSFPVPNGFTISLAGPQGQVVGGLVAGALVSAGVVYVIAASFNNPSYNRLPVDDDARNSESGGGGDGHSPAVSGGGESGHAPEESCGVSMYSCHLPSEVIWAPSARQPPPQPPPY
ncbi:AT-hook motif nuclear-localized protein 17-like [Juglans microcarpa x Juglans regia]|uniref:AT-hook motif nuclear-localized protein 17-like n=1 Tax=Juglans microcarpa x Juglans regia TaxID=2249226 RepID=UPI001B7EAA73|nr:AT-hook motif nuclear-localized protein 17-like [Juglans microcarpa x Juglans regia]